MRSTPFGGNVKGNIAEAGANSKFTCVERQHHTPVLFCGQCPNLVQWHGKEAGSHGRRPPAYSDENQAAIALSPDQPSGSAIISLRKAGMLIADVRDKATGKPVSASYKLSVPKRWQTQGQLSHPLLIHPSTDVMLEVSASGYKTWFYSDASNPLRPLPLRLESGEQRSLRIELEPEENAALQGKTSDWR
jgi:hypothetical protein